MFVPDAFIGRKRNPTGWHSSWLNPFGSQEIFKRELPMTAIGNWIAWFSHKAASIALVGMMALILIEVGLRYSLGISTLVAHDFASYLLVFFVFVSLAFIAKKDRHIRVTLITHRFPAKIQAVFEVGALCLTLFIVSYLFYWSLDMTLAAIHTGERAETIAQTPLAIPKAFIPFGSLLFALQLITLIIEKAKNISSPPRVERPEEVGSKSEQQL
jgi:TRAP-type transport system small permease protein